MRPANLRLIISISMCALFAGGIGAVQAEENAYLRGGMEGFVLVGRPETVIPAPIAGALIELFTEESPDSSVASATTDEKGYYKLVDLHHGPYSVRVSAEKFRTINVIVWIQAGIVLKRDFYLETITPVQSGLLKGKVVEDVGNLDIVPPPIPDAQIRVYIAKTGTSDSGCPPSPSPVREAHTNESGEYQIPELPYGAYIVTADAKGYLKGKAVINMSTLELIQDFQLKVTPTPTLTPIPTPTPVNEMGVIAGMVTEYAGDQETAQTPIPNAHIRVFKAWISAGANTNTDNIPIAETYTDENGNYNIPDIPYGFYHVVANAQGYQEALAPVQLFAPEVVQDFQLKKGLPTPTATPTPTEKGTLFGHVVQEVGMLTIVPPPIPGAHVMVFKSLVYSNGETKVDPEPVADALTDQDGVYNISELPYGFYRVTVEAEGYCRGIANLQMYAPEVELNFKLKKLVPTPTVTPIPEGSGKVFGVVMAQDSETSAPYPLAKALVEVSPMVKDSESRVNCIVPPVARAITDENGNYVIENVPVGNWNITARAENYQCSIKNFEMTPDGEIRVDFILKPSLEPGPGGIYGTVMGLKPEEDGTSETEKETKDEPDQGIPIAGARVEVFNAPVYDAKDNIVPGPDKPVAVVFTNEEGKYSVVNLEQGLYMVRVTAEKFYPEHKIAPVADEPVELNFLLKPVLEPEPTPTGCAIRGRVVGIPISRDETPSPIAGAMVKIQKRISIKNSGESDIEPIIVFTNEGGW
ncbi:MAG: carboxypeptidase-like regulatory domain-containing protein, partial [Candidatus Sumerlaeota bacterium]|nr:carboxypeptidase-like regulatory domain-containing protein [Candidatus Sumerlaeota bacterium]